MLNMCEHQCVFLNNIYPLLLLVKGPLFGLLNCGEGRAIDIEISAVRKTMKNSERNFILSSLFCNVI